MYADLRGLIALHLSQQPWVLTFIDHFLQSYSSAQNFTVDQEFNAGLVLQKQPSHLPRLLQ